MATLRYPALIESGKDLYWVTFPDIDGVAATGKTIDAAIQDAEAVLRIYIEEMEREGWAVNPPSSMEALAMPPGSQMVSIPLIRPSNGRVRVNCVLDEGLVAFIDDEARRRNMTRTSYISWAVRRIAEMGG